ncbi:MAG TPA: 4-(cytidine 5'-diphospho)-2-C-methyl-D-erythritol kinase [Thermoanaerobaculia bacterium]|jgi:4-diphosphocytidyl-2-C-methyl-D-erythritol kinase|nr:4-(cytidine 5'-diphospho)-2-C-methyl-D-erythritol kinase [Thermoanaerobaculia bacterium]
MSSRRLEVRSPAKVNLHLQVVGKRADGYHELRTIFQTVDLADEIAIELDDVPGVRLAIDGAELSAGPDNLAHRAATGFLGRWAADRGVAITLRKRIPLGAGLGGGSSNAASILLALQRLLGNPAPPADLWLLARELGADVPYFLVGGTALGVGRGDEVTPLPELPERELWLVLPPIHVSTAEAFADLGELTGKPIDPRILALVQRGELGWGAFAHAANDFEAAVFRRWPELAALHADLVSTGATARLSGSGAAFWLTDLTESGSAHLLGERLTGLRLPEGTRIERCRTVARASLFQSECR